MAEARVERRLVAILAADVAGYSRLMGVDEEGTLAALKACRREHIDPKIAEHRGRIVKTTGDGALVEFASAVDAVRCAIAVQRGMKEHNEPLVPDRRIEFRIGVHVGDIIMEEGDIFGDGVNIAARLEGIAEPGGISISDDAFRQVIGKIDVAFEDAGDQTLKNIARPVKVYRAQLGEASVKAEPILPAKPSIAVLPFQNMSGDPEQEYFVDGIVEEIIAALSRMRTFLVIARNSTFVYKNKPVSVRQVGTDLGVRYVLEGSVRKVGKRVRIIAQLIDATTDKHIWADRYDGDFEDIFDLQDRVTANVVGAIQPSILSSEIERAKRKRPDNLDAYDCLLRALPSVWSLDKDANDVALVQLRRAVDLEPGYPLALALAAWCEARRAVYNWTDDLDTAKAEGLRLAKLAGDLMSDDPTVLTMLGAAHTVAGDLQLASMLIEKSLVLDQNSAWAWNRSGWLNVYRAQPDIALQQFNKALRLSPFDPMNSNCFVGIGAAHFVAERYADAATWIEKALLENPHVTWAYRVLVPAYVKLGRMAEAKKAIQTLARQYPDLSVSGAISALVFSKDTLANIADGLRKAGLRE